MDTILTLLAIWVVGTVAVTFVIVIVLQTAADNREHDHD